MDAPAADISQATAHFDAGRLGLAESIARSILQQNPRDAAAMHLLGLVARSTGRLDVAAEFVRRAISLDPDRAAFRSSLGRVLESLDRLPEAIDAHRRATELSPDNPVAWNDLGNALRSAGRREEAVACCSRAIELRPDFADAMHHLAGALAEQGRAEEAVTYLRRALILRPDLPAARDALLLNLHYLDGVSPGMIFLEHRDAQTRKAERGTRNENEVPRSSFRVPRSPKPLAVRKRGKIRIGYVSPDFRRHPTGFFIEPILAHHDKKLFDVYAYSAAQRPDEITSRFLPLVDRWREIAHLNTDAAEKIILDDKLDVLIDLAGHAPGNRLDVFARKPAAVQMTYLGYPDTTGVAEIDCRITDHLADPPGADLNHTEKLLRLPGCFLCYRPGPMSPPVLPRDPSAAGVTFAWFGDLAAVGGRALRAFASILRATPDSRLLMQAAALAEPAVQRRTHDAFADLGVEPHRVELVGPLPSHTDPLELYHRVDVALDAFPYNGAMTTCEALWMGVPVIALAGQSHASRVGVSVLSAVGLNDLVADSVDHYVRLATDLAADTERLGELRATLRSRTEQSSLTDAAAFTRSFEDSLMSVLRPGYRRKTVKPKSPRKPKAPAKPKPKSPRRPRKKK